MGQRLYDGIAGTLLFIGTLFAALGFLADANGIDWVYSVCSFLPMIGLLTILLPSMKELRANRHIA